MSCADTSCFLQVCVLSSGTSGASTLTSLFRPLQWDGGWQWCRSPFVYLFHSPRPGLLRINSAVPPAMLLPINPLYGITSFIHYFGSFAILTEVLSLLMCYSIPHLMKASKYCTLKIQHIPAAFKKIPSMVFYFRGCLLNVCTVFLWYALFFLTKECHPSCPGHFHSDV